jgi:predicted N-formylglutamate amidohydrolase
VTDVGRSLVVTCEHARNAVPAELSEVFAGAEAVLASHRGWDPGALTAARAIAAAFDAPLFEGEVSRLVVDLNRSAHNPRVLSPWTRPLPRPQRDALMARYWTPYRERATEEIARRITAGESVFHVSVHSFTPVLDGVVRTAEIGLLYDPARRAEERLARAWQAALRRALPDLRVRRNYPYRGNSDGFVVPLRQRFGEADFVGVELELNHGTSEADMARATAAVIAVIGGAA